MGLIQTCDPDTGLRRLSETRGALLIDREGWAGLN